jgi:hypothetical protein
MGDVLTGVAAEAVSPVVRGAIESAAQGLMGYVGKAARGLIDRTVVELKIGFEPYLNNSYHRCRHFKTILNTQTPLEVTKHYVNINLTNGDSKKFDDEVIDSISALKFVVVTGLAGSGKSMFMKYMTCKFFESPRYGLPLFVELRQLNSHTNRDLLTFIRVTCAGNSSKISSEQFNLALNAGIFTIILDGFDEINPEFRDEIQSQILGMRRMFEATPVVVTSRPDDRFGSWVSAWIFRVMEMTKDQSLELIKGLEYDKKVKQRFYKEVKGNLYDSHPSFLSSPLLITIMLLTYEEFAEIPAKMHSFYNQAFDTLFQKHDAQKEQYKRKTHTGLARDDFRAAFAVFCAISYLDSKIAFSDSELLVVADRTVAYLKQAGVASFRALSSDQFILDLKESVCMLHQDGLQWTFVHRSFQEYFSALFVTTMHSSKVRRIVDKFAMRFADNVIIMAHDMARETIEQEWVLPAIRDLTDALDLGGVDDGRVAIRLAKFINEFRFSGRGQVYDRKAAASSDASEFMSIDISSFVDDHLLRFEYLQRLYPEILAECLPIYRLLRIQKTWALEHLLKKENAGKPRYDYFLRLCEDDGVGRAPSRGGAKLNNGDDWWLKTLGFDDAFVKMRDGFDVIARAIAAREMRKSSILEDFL